MTLESIAAASWQGTRHAEPEPPAAPVERRDAKNACIDCGKHIQKSNTRCMRCYGISIKSTKRRADAPGAVRDVQRIEYSVFAGQKEMHRR